MKDVITRQTVVDKLAAYLHHELSLSGLVGLGSPTSERLA